MEKLPLDTTRSVTDKSLQSERELTDAALRSKVRTIESESDVAMRASRATLDEGLQRDRAEADLKLSVGTAASDQVQDERRRVDARIGAQRELADATIRQERLTKSAGKCDSLSHERLRTDQSLSEERVLIDQEFNRSDGLLEQEQAAHAVTKAAVDARDELLAIVSHDLQDPLNIIAICSDEFLGSCGEQRLTDLEVQWVDTVRRHAASMFRLVSDLLDVEYIASGKLKITPGPCDMTALTGEILQSFQILARRQGLTLTGALPAHAVSAQADSERVRQVLANLISNALKFSPTSGTILVSLVETAAEVLVSVTDTGPGIAVDQRDTIFDRFVQLGAKDRRGVGLGLFISKWIVNAHGGRIWVEGAQGEGSTFLVALPCAPSTREK